MMNPTDKPVTNAQLNQEAHEGLDIFWQKWSRRMHLSVTTFVAQRQVAAWDHGVLCNSLPSITVAMMFLTRSAVVCTLRSPTCEPREVIVGSRMPEHPRHSR